MLVDNFVKDFLKGTQHVGTKNTSFEDSNKSVFPVLHNLNETNSIDKVELAFFMKELLKSQVKELMMRIEVERFQNDDIPEAQNA